MSTDLAFTRVARGLFLGPRDRNGDMWAMAGKRGEWELWTFSDPERGKIERRQRGTFPTQADAMLYADLHFAY